MVDLVGLGWASGTRASLRNTGDFSPQMAPGAIAALPPTEIDKKYVGGFGSNHQGGAQFCFADGSIRFVTHSIDPILYQNYGHRAEGAMMGDPL